MLQLIFNKKFIFAGVIYATAAGAFLIKEYITEEKYEGRETLKNKVAIVTGANSGVGRGVAEEIANRGAIVIMACRDMVACEKSRRNIVMKTENKYVYCRPCDLASFKSIRSFVKRFKEEQMQLDVLVANAGVMRCPKTLTQDGIEYQLGVNHMGHFLLTNLLLDYLKIPQKSKIVVLTSVGHVHGKINKEDLNSDNSYDPADAYNQSKLANCLFVNELSTRLLGTNISVNAVHPGLALTNLNRHMPSESSISGKIINVFSWMFKKSPQSAATPIMNILLNPDLDKVTGKYFINKRISPMSKDADDVELAMWLWAVSEKWTKLNEIQSETSALSNA